MGWRVLLSPLGFLLGGFPLLFQETGGFWLMIVVMSVPTLPLRTLIHEAGHAFAARLMGQVVSQARIGCGPVRHKLRAGEVTFEIRAYPWMGGLVRFFDPKGTTHRGAKAFIIAAGPLANLLAAVISFTLSYLCQDVEAIAAIFLGFGFFNALGTVFNLIPSRFGDNETVPSDGRQLLNLFKRGEPPNPRLLQIGRIINYSHMGRYAEAVATAQENQEWHSPSSKLILAAQILHDLSRSQGNRVALDFYFAHQAEFENPENIDADATSGVPWIQANVAWSALKLGDPAVAELAGRMAEAAIAVVPDKPDMWVVHGAWLVSVDRSDEGLPFLVRAARTISNNIDKADICAFIARGWRQKENASLAQVYEALEAHIRTLP